jgi:hypothetical protein
VTDTVDEPDVIRPPRTVVIAFAVTIAHVVLSILNSAMLWGFQDYLRRQLVKSNDKLKASDKNKKTDFNLDTPKGLHNVNHDLHSGLNVGLIQIVIFGLLLMLLAVNFRRGRGWARWAEILVLVIVVQAPFRLFNLGGDAPLLMRGVSALVGITGVAVIVLLVIPESSRYFAAVRGVRVGDGASGAASMGFRGLFRPRTPPSDDDASATTTTPTKRAPRGGQAVRRPARPVATKPVATKAAAPPPDVTTEAKAERRPAKAKVRAGIDSFPSDPSASSVASDPAASSGGSDPTAPSRPSGAAAKSRGKSRRGT